MLQSCESMDHGITVVTSVSRAWLRHTAGALGDLGLPVGLVAPVNSDESWGPSLNRTLDGIHQGNIRIVYMYAPFLASRDIIDAVNLAPGGLHRFVIGDAGNMPSQVGRFLYSRLRMQHI